MRVTNLNPKFSYIVGGLIVAPLATVTIPDAAFPEIKNNQDLQVTGPYSTALVQPRPLQLGDVFDPAGTLTGFNAKYGQFYTPAPGTYDTSGNFLGSVIPAFTWATLPAAASYAGLVVRVTDVGGGPTLAGGGNFFVSNGVRWKPMNGNIVLDTIDTANSGIANTTEQELNPNAVIIPGGVVSFTDRLRVTGGISKSGGTDICTFRLRLGPLKSILDPAIATITIPAANTSFNFQMILKRISATSIQRQGNGDSATSFGGSALGYPAAVTGLSSLDTIGQYLSLTQQMTTGTEFITIQDYILEDLPTDSA